MEPCLHLNIPVESMVRKLILTCNQEYQPILRDQAFSLFRLLCEMGFDFYRSCSSTPNWSGFLKKRSA